jgi:hypothetical protein
MTPDDVGTCPGTFSPGPNRATLHCQLLIGHTGRHIHVNGPASASWPFHDHNTAIGSTTSTPGQDVIDHPPHYNAHPSGIECIVIAEHHNFCIGNVLKYLWRAGLKRSPDASAVNDLRKAAWYLNREIKRLERTK